MLNNRTGRFKLQFGDLELGGSSNDPIAECYELANKFYTPELYPTMKLWVYIDRWAELDCENADEYCELPYAGPIEQKLDM
jgi:hypothetical protein